MTDRRVTEAAFPFASSSCWVGPAAVTQLSLKQLKKRHGLCETKWQHPHRELLDFHWSLLLLKELLTICIALNMEAFLALYLLYTDRREWAVQS